MAYQLRILLAVLCLSAVFTPTAEAAMALKVGEMALNRASSFMSRSLLVSVPSSFYDNSITYSSTINNNSLSSRPCSIFRPINIVSSLLSRSINMSTVTRPIGFSPYAFYPFASQSRFLSQQRHQQHASEEVIEYKSDTIEREKYATEFATERAEGRVEGKIEGEVKTLIGLIKKGKITLDEIIQSNDYSEKVKEALKKDYDAMI